MRRGAGRGVTAAIAAAISLVGGLGIAVAVRPASPDAVDRSGPGQAVSPAPSPATTSTTAPEAVPPVAESQSQLVPDTALKLALDAVWSRTPRGCLTVADRGQVLYAANPEAAVAPASVIKMLTASAALDLLDENEVLKTQVRSAAVGPGGVIAGDVWLVGGGDPLLGTADWATATERGDVTSLETLADRVVAAGVSAIDGRVVGDESRYDALRYVDSWPPRLIQDGEIGPMSALEVNGGFRTLGHPGEPFADPPSAAAGVLTELLLQRGVRVQGGAAAGQAPPEARELAAVESAPVGRLVQTMLRESDNMVAELLVKEIGLRSAGVGSTSAGVQAVAQSLQRQGLPVGGTTVADGSGLSDDDRVTCRLLASLLSQAEESLIGGLPLAARDGTLERRFVGTPVAGRMRAKTGSLDGIASLAGTVQTAAGNRLTFAYVVNGLPVGDSGRKLQDALAAALVGSP